MWHTYRYDTGDYVQVVNIFLQAAAVKWKEHWNKLTHLCNQTRRKLSWDSLDSGIWKHHIPAKAPFELVSWCSDFCSELISAQLPLHIFAFTAPGVLCSQTCQHCLFISVSGMILKLTSQPGSILNEVWMQITTKPSFPFYRRFLFDWFILQDLIL